LGVKRDRPSSPSPPHSKYVRPNVITDRLLPDVFTSLILLREGEGEKLGGRNEHEETESRNQESALGVKRDKKRPNVITDRLLPDVFTSLILFFCLFLPPRLTLDFCFRTEGGVSEEPQGEGLID
jgi:hypothetical protein